MAFTHHLDVMLRQGDDPVLVRDIHARLVVAVHRTIKDHDGQPLACAWPDMGRQVGEFGLLFRVFGEPAVLTAFIAAMDKLSQAQLIRAFPMMPVPATTQTVAYLRNRAEEKKADGVANGRRIYKGRAPRESQQNKKLHKHSLRIFSSSNAMLFSLFIEKAVTGKDDGGGKFYGLGYTLPSF